MEATAETAKSLSARVYAGQVDILYSNQPIGIAATILNGIIMIAAFWKSIPHPILITWGLMLAVISLVRTSVMMQYQIAKEGRSNVRKWERLFLIGIACSGVTWGTSAFWLLYVQAIEFHLLLAFVIGGMVAGASSTLSARKASFYAYAIPGLAPLNIAFFAYADLLHASMGCMTLLFFIFLAVNAQRTNEVIYQSLYLRYEKDDLIKRLGESHDETKEALETLQREAQKRRSAETELRILSDNLEEQVRSRTKELEHANSELDAFTYSVSHDLQGPVRAMNGFAEMILKEYRDKMDPEFRRKFDVIRGNSKLMGDLIEGLLKLSRISRTELSFSRLDIAKLFNSVQRELEAFIPGRHVEIIVEKLAPAYGDAVLIKQIFYNILSNAIKFTQYREDAVINVSSYVEDDQIVYCIKDNGAGFNMAYSEKLFGAFQRLHASSEFQGSGVGLAIVKRIIDRHNGRIWAKSELGKGATFCFSLPSERS